MSKFAKRFIAISLLLTPLLFAGLFWGLNDRPSEAAKHEAAELNQVIDLIIALNARAKAHPEEAKTWYWLGRLYLRLGDTEQGNLALQEAARLEAQ